MLKLCEQNDFRIKKKLMQIRKNEKLLMRFIASVAEKYLINFIQNDRLKCRIITTTTEKNCSEQTRHRKLRMNREIAFFS